MHLLSKAIGLSEQWHQILHGYNNLIQIVILWTENHFEENLICQPKTNSAEHEIDSKHKT